MSIFYFNSINGFYSLEHDLLTSDWRTLNTDANVIGFILCQLFEGLQQILLECNTAFVHKMIIISVHVNWFYFHSLKNFSHLQCHEVKLGSMSLGSVGETSSFKNIYALFRVSLFMCSLNLKYSTLIFVT